MQLIALDAEVDTIICEFVADGGDFRECTPRYLIAPTQVTPIAREPADAEMGSSSRPWNAARRPAVVRAGSIQISKPRVIENTREYRKGKWQAHDTPTTHFVEARFELGETAAASLHKGEAVIVTGREHTSSWGDDANKQYGRVIDADSIGADLARATVTISRNARDDQQ